MPTEPPKIMLEDNDGYGFIRHNSRPPKPRKTGVTEIRGPYYSVMGKRYLQDILETMGYHVDGLKFAGGSFSLFPEEKLRELIAIAHEHNVYVSTGGWIEHVLTQSDPHAAVERYLRQCKSVGFDVVEVSCGFLSIPPDDWLRLVDKVHAAGLQAKPELGIQFGAGGDTQAGELASLGTSDPSKAVNLGKRFVAEAGVERLMIESEGITENVESWRTDVIQHVLRELPADKVMFEAADPKVFNWYVREFGADVNLFVDHSQIVQLSGLREGIWVGAPWLGMQSHVLRLFTTSASPPLVKRVQKCAIDNFHKDLSFLDTAVPIAAGEFADRRDRLAKALVLAGADGFVLEPGFSFQYYGNVSQADWEPWEPEERPFLIVVLPEEDASGTISGKTAFLAPSFEEERVRMLGIPMKEEEELDIVVWEEHWNPYETLFHSRLFSGKQQEKKPIDLMVDEEIRDFIARGLDKAGFQTVGLGPIVEQVRQLKSTNEIELLRAVNTGTVAAVRAMRPCLVAGLTEDEVTDILNNVLLSVGFSLFFNIVLFEEHGALPHGGFVTGQKKLTYETMVVIDVGAHYLGYSSDISRSFFIDPPPEKPLSLCLWSTCARYLHIGNFNSEDTTFLVSDTGLYAEKLHVWQIVRDAQNAAAAAFKPNQTAASVDIAARTVIENAGYGHGFTHRLGHGIGIKAHESPYLNKWNTEAILLPGMTFTDEPGIYLTGKFGVRHEDIYLVKESGEAELLTGTLARGPYEP